MRSAWGEANFSFIAPPAQLPVLVGETRNQLTRSPSEDYSLKHPADVLREGIGGTADTIDRNL
jgi:hypothetical protein